MTNAEAFAVLLNGSVSNERINQLLAFNGIDPQGEWVKSENNPINCSFYGLVINEILATSNANTGISSISEGGMSISYNSSSPYLKDKIKGLALESGCSSLIDTYTANKIKDISHLLSR